MKLCFSLQKPFFVHFIPDIIFLLLQFYLKSPNHTHLKICSPTRHIHRSKQILRCTWIQRTAKLYYLMHTSSERLPGRSIIISCCLFISPTHLKICSPTFQLTPRSSKIQAHWQNDFVAFNLLLSLQHFIHVISIAFYKFFIISLL